MKYRPAYDTPYHRTVRPRLLGKSATDDMHIKNLLNVSDLVLYLTTTPLYYTTSMEAGMDTQAAPQESEAGYDRRME
jgi:hypothetical protein